MDAVNCQLEIIWAKEISPKTKKKDEEISLNQLQTMANM